MSISPRRPAGRALLSGVLILATQFFLCRADQSSPLGKSLVEVSEDAHAAVANGDTHSNESNVLDVHKNSTRGKSHASLILDDAEKRQSFAQHNRSASRSGAQRVTAESMRKRWKKTFEEIKDLVVDTSPSSGVIDAKHLLNRWKLFIERDGTDDINGRALSLKTGETGETEELSTEAQKVADDAKKSWTRLTRQRFDGFATWERRLQQWADEVEKSQQQFLDELSAGGEYPLSSFGKPLVTQTDGDRSSKEKKGPVVEGVVVVNETAIEAPAREAEKRRYKTAQISPRPVRSGEPVLSHTDIADKSKRIWIVTTAALPWMTGTAVNPLLRAAYMTAGRSDASGSVTLMLPWLERPSDQERVYGKDRAFKSQEDQEEFIRTWLSDTANMKEASEELRIQWYTAWQNRAENSVYSMGDITALIPGNEVDICVLEEPEHLNWYRAPGESWTTKFKHVVGIVHTNYFVYAQEQPAALVRAPGMRLLCSWMCRAHCHRLIKLSGTLDAFAAEKELVENVHGVRGTFLDAGKELRKTLLSADGKLDPVFGPDADPSVYFIGKMLWSKGIGSLMELLKYAEESAGLKVRVDMYGGGPDKDEAETKAAKLGLDMPFHGPIDHAELAPSHKIFINPSTSEVLCTTVAEALAMGKFVIVPSHPSNDFFAQFPNCLTYANKEEFVGNLYYAFTHSPKPLTEEYSHALSWEAATERFEAAGSVSVAEADAMSLVLSTPDAGVEIKLPPLIEDEERRKQIATTLGKSRSRFRQFRSRLSQEIMQSNVLPADLQQRVVKELDKRLDLDLDEILESPKLRLKLSPAELDKQLLELYDTVTQGPSGDVLRVIGGGNDVAMQDFYLKQQARRDKRKGMIPGQVQDDVFAGATFGLPQFIDDITAEEEPSPTKWIKRALRRNLQQQSDSLIPLSLKKTTRKGSATANQRDSTKMSLSDVYPSSRFREIGISMGLSFLPRPHKTNHFPRQTRSFYGPLI